MAIRHVLCLIIHLFIYIVVVCILEPYAISHWTATLSAKSRHCRPSSSLVCGQLLLSVEHCLSFATWTLVSHWKAHFLQQHAQ